MIFPSVALGDIAAIDRIAATPDQIRGRELYVGLENITSNGEFEHIASAGDAGLRSTKFVFTEAHVLYGKLRPYLAKIAAPKFEGICSTDILRSDRALNSTGATCCTICGRQEWWLTQQKERWVSIFRA